MRNYRFAILQYHPPDEFELRGEVQRLTADLIANGWIVISISLQKLLLDRVRAQGPEWIDRVVRMEKHVAGIEPERGLNYLKSKLLPLIDGPDGIAADCSRLICEYADRHPDTVDRTVALSGARAHCIPSFDRQHFFVTSTAGREMCQWSCSIQANGEVRQGCRSWVFSIRIMTTGLGSIHEGGHADSRALPF